MKVATLHKNTLKISTFLAPSFVAQKLPKMYVYISVCVYYLQHYKNLPIIWLVKYPKANADNIQPCKCKFQPNTFVIGTMAMGIITRSALLIKLAKLHRATIREVRVNHRILAIFQFLFPI